MENIVKLLRIRIGAKLAVLKAEYSKYANIYKDNEYYDEFINIIKKSSYSIDDINDLLLCYSDHYLFEEEVLSFLKNGDVLYYDSESFGTKFDLNDFLFYFLLSSKNTKVLEETLKLIPLKNIRSDRNYEFAEYCSLNGFDTFYDIYHNLKSVIDCKDETLQKRQAIGFIYYLDEITFIETLNEIGVTFADVEKVVKEYEETGNLLNPHCLSKLLQKVSFINDREFGSEELYNKVKKEYNKYVSSHSNFKLSEFVKYYNETFNDDFSSFYYRVTEKVLLDEKLLHQILSAFSFNNYKNTTFCCGEYIDEFESFSDSKVCLEKGLKDYFDRETEKYEKRKLIIEKYDHLIEVLKKPFQYTYNYFIYLNVLPEHRAAFKAYVAWHYVYAKTFSKDIRNSSKLQKDETFKVILEQCKLELADNFRDWNSIRNKYFDFIKEYVGEKYISSKRWKEQFNLLYEEQVVLISEKYFIQLDKLVDNGEFSVNSYLEVNDIGFSLTYAADVLKKFKPELSSIIDKVMSAYFKEQTAIREEKLRKEKEERVSACSEIISRFLEKDFKAKKEFLDSEGLTEGQFDKILETVEQDNFELFVKFINKFNSLKAQRYALLMKTVDNVLAGLVNGVNENGIVRPFNFLDYCLLTKLPFDKFAILAVNSNKINNTNIRQFRQFSRVVSNYSMVSNQYIFNEVYIVTIDGEQHEVSQDEKAIALSYMRKHNLSNYYVLYKLVLQKVLKGQITRESIGIVPVEDEKQLSKKIS